MNNEISPFALMELYVDTMKKCGMFLQKADDDIIEYNIFEEFDIGVISFLHEQSLVRLENAGLISREIRQLSADLRKRFMELQNTDQWNCEAVRTSDKWEEILKISDAINHLLSEKQVV